MHGNVLNALQLAGTRTVIAAVTSTQVNGSVPNLPDGNRARFVAITAQVQVTIDVGGSGANATGNSLMVIPAGGAPIILNVTGMTTISTFGFGTGNVYIAALANQ